jgi:aminoglycoside 2'-N-acetyltransferase I
VTERLTRFRLRRLPTAELTPAERRAIRRLLWDAFAREPEDERFTEDDWHHALGGAHIVLDVAGQIVAHAAVVERQLHVAGVPIRTGYVEAVATRPTRQGKGFGTMLMRDVNAYLGERFELGALGTGRQGFYERLGWETWCGASSVRTPGGPEPTPDDDGYIMVLRTRRTPPLDLESAISCDPRQGDAW